MQTDFSERISILKPEDAPASPVKRTVTWHEDTPEPAPTHLAISIPRSKNIKDPAPHTIYVIELWQDGRSWTIKRRYSEFEKFHKTVVAEDWLNEDYLPPLPSKQWLNPKRWFRMFDRDEFTRERRLDLQEYLRGMVKITLILDRSFALQQFLEINKTKLNSKGRVRHIESDVDDRDSEASVAESVEGGKVAIFDPSKSITIRHPFYNDC